MLNLGNVDASSVLYIPFNTFDSNGASVTISGLAVTDIEIYKNGSVTQRSSDAGYTLLDTDGIDFDGITGIHGFSIDLADNTDAGFYSAGAFYWVVVSAVTVDTRTVNFVAATFRIGPAAANATQFAGQTITAAAGVTLPSSVASPTNITAGTITTVTTVTGLTASDVGAIKAKTDNLPSDPADESLIIAATNAIAALIGTPAGASVSADIAAVLAKWTTAVTESYAADGAAPTPEQAMMMILQSLHEFAIVSTTRTVKKLDGTTTAMTFTLDDATNPTSTTRAT